MYILRVKNNYAERNSNLGHKILKTNVCLVNMYFVTGPCRDIFLSNSFISGLFGSLRQGLDLLELMIHILGALKPCNYSYVLRTPAGFLSLASLSALCQFYSHTHTAFRLLILPSFHPFLPVLDHFPPS